MGDTVFVCDTCGVGAGEPCGQRIADTLRRADLGVDVRAVSCLNMCDEPLAMALRAPGKVAYLFAGIRPDEDVGDAIALIKLYRDAPDGIIEDARPAGRLRFCLKGRIPAL